MSCEKSKGARRRSDWGIRLSSPCHCEETSSLSELWENVSTPARHCGGDFVPFRIMEKRINTDMSLRGNDCILSCRGNLIDLLIHGKILFWICSFSLSFLTAPKKKEKTEPKEKEIRHTIRDCKISVRKFARHNDGKFSSKIQQSLYQSYRAFQAQQSFCERYKPQVCNKKSCMRILGQNTRTCFLW